MLHCTTHVQRTLEKNVKHSIRQRCAMYVPRTFFDVFIIFFQDFQYSLGNTIEGALLNHTLKNMIVSHINVH